MFRTRLASCALGVVLLQLTLLFAAPLSACCATPAAKSHHTAVRSADVEDCCPPGSHPPGQCPLHRSARANTRTSPGECRIRCSAPQAAAFIAGVVGVLPIPVAASISIDSSDVAGIPAARPIARAAHPDAPPPKLL